MPLLIFKMYAKIIMTECPTFHQNKIQRQFPDFPGKKKFPGRLNKENLLVYLHLQKQTFRYKGKILMISHNGGWRQHQG